MNWFKKQWTKVKSWVYSILVAIGLAVPLVLLGADVSMQWTMPVTYEDGSVLPLNEIAEVRIYKQTFPLGTDITVEARSYSEHAVLPNTETTFTDFAVTDGIHCYVGTVVATNGLESRYSNEFCETVDARQPSPPQGLAKVP